MAPAPSLQFHSKHYKKLTVRAREGLMFINQWNQNWDFLIKHLLLKAQRSIRGGRKVVRVRDSGRL